MLGVWPEMIDSSVAYRAKFADPINKNKQDDHRGGQFGYGNSNNFGDHGSRSSQQSIAGLCSE